MLISTILIANLSKRSKKNTNLQHSKQIIIHESRCYEIQWDCHDLEELLDHRHVA